jgi:hypothetical protein
MAITGHVGAVYIETADPPAAFTKKATQADSSYTQYRIIDASKWYWDKKSLCWCMSMMNWYQLALK